MRSVWNISTAVSSKQPFSAAVLSSVRAGFARCGLPPTATVAVAVSGGVDSMTLLALCRALVDERHLEAVIALHINHSLRPAAETEEDYRLVRDYCAMHAIPFDYAVIAPDEIARATRRSTRGGSDGGDNRIDDSDAAQPTNAHRDSGLEGAARHARLRCFAALLQRHNLRYLCTAHHRDDNAETLLMRLLGGGGVNGLTGISPVQQMRTIMDDGCRYQCTLLRPLLGVAKAELVDWARAAAIPYCEDSSNRDVSILRNALRRDLIPAVSGLFPRYHRALEQVAEQVGVWQAYVDTQHGELLRWEVWVADEGAWRGAAATVSHAVVGFGDCCWRIDAQRFFAAHPALQFQSFYAIANRLGARRRLPHRFVRQCLTAFLSDYRGERGSGHGLRCYSDAACLYLERYRPLLRFKKGLV